MNHINLTESLSSNILDIIDKAKKIAEQQNYELFIVGGPVRDILLNEGHNIHDLDLALIGNTQKFSETLKSEINYTQYNYHETFKTATFIINEKLHIDIAMARTELYLKPGTLPIVEATDRISLDLKRRDFTINAMAIQLTGNDYGLLIDEYNGKQDLERGVIKILHLNSFQDDPTRMYRAIRYATRLGFALDYTTKEALKNNLTSVKNLTSERIRYELECMVNEPNPAYVFSQAQSRGLLEHIYPPLDDVFFEDLDVAESLAPLDFTTALCVICKDFEPKQLDEFIIRLGLSKNTAKEIIAFNAIQLVPISTDKADIYNSLSAHTPERLRLMNLITFNHALQEMIDIYLTELIDIQPYLNSEELISLGVQPGPLFGEKLKTLMTMQLKEKLNSKEEAEKWVRANWLLK